MPVGALGVGSGRVEQRGETAPDGEPMRTRAKLGEMTMRVELQAELLEKRGYGGRAEKALAARGRVSPLTGRAYSLVLLCEACRVPHSSA